MGDDDTISGSGGGAIGVIVTWEAMTLPVMVMTLVVMGTQVLMALLIMVMMTLVVNGVALAMVVGMLTAVSDGGDTGMMVCVTTLLAIMVTLVVM